MISHKLMKFSLIAGKMSTTIRLQMKVILIIHLQKEKTAEQCTSGTILVQFFAEKPSLEHIKNTRSCKGLSRSIIFVKKSTWFVPEIISPVGCCVC